MRYFSLVPVVAGAIMIAGALGSVTAKPHRITARSLKAMDSAGIRATASAHPP
jgi:hypothetical protein